MDQKLIVTKFKEKIEDVNNSKRLVEIRNEYFSKKGMISQLMQDIKNIENNQKMEYGQKVNELKNNLQEIYNAKEKEIKIFEYEQLLQSEKIDLTIPGTIEKIGSQHPLKSTLRIAEDIFTALGFYITSGREVETEMYNFEYLNMPKDHPARDMQDTFYVNNDYLLRTHTSGMQIREMIKNQKSIKLISHGKVYRRDEDDATHSHQFMQIEGLWIGEKVSLADLKTTLQVFLTKFFKKDIKLKLRPSYFPFTEPSIEVDVTCVNCNGKGCNICKNTGLIEILGAGMVNKKLFEYCGLDPDRYQGFAFGIGVERITMIKHKIKDIRDFYTNDIKFLNQF
jgi:phenylalanyl-tRNA synthetase alpha chain